MSKSTPDLKKPKDKKAVEVQKQEKERGGEVRYTSMASQPGNDINESL